MNLHGPAVALLELDSIARGMIVADAVLKKAQVLIALAEPVTPGKYLLLFEGGVGEVQESYRAGIEAGGPMVIDKLLLTRVAPGLLRALNGTFAEPFGESLGIVETHTVAATLLSADAALKKAEVRLHRLHLARGIGGKGYYTITGPLHMVEAALEAAAAAIEPNLLLTTELISRPHLELKGPVI